MRLYLSKSCCGCSLKTGTKIIGGLELFFVIILWILCMYGISLPNSVRNPTQQYTGNGRKLVPSAMDMAMASGAAMGISMVAEIVACIVTIYLVRVVLLLVGSHKEKLWMMVPWIGSSMMNFIALPPLLIYIWVKLSSFPGICFGVTVGIFLQTVISGYLFLVVLSRFEEIRAKGTKVEMKYPERSNPLPGV